MAVGGGLGAVARYAVELGLPGGLGATFLANVTGCFLLGLLVYGTRAGAAVSDRGRLFVGTGFCSSYTTYSTFVLGVVRARPVVGLGYLAASYAVGLLAVGVAAAVVRRRHGRES